MNTNEHEYYFRSDKLFGCHILASIRGYSCSFVAKILFRAGQRPQTTKSVSARRLKWRRLCENRRLNEEANLSQRRKEAKDAKGGAPAMAPLNSQRPSVCPTLALLKS